MVYRVPPFTGSATCATSVEPGSALDDIVTVFIPRTEVMSCVSSLALFVSPQFTIAAVVLSRSNGMTLFGCTGKPTPGPIVGTVPALRPDWVGEASTMLASMSFAGLFAGRAAFDVIAWKTKSDAGLSTGTAMIGVICGMATDPVVTGGREGRA